jgi:hypothetical protein
MFEISSQSTETCLVAHFSGKVTGDEYQQFLDAVDERLQNGSEINLVISLIGFEFYGDLESAKADLKFVLGEYRHFHRAAFVGDRKWIMWFTRLIGPVTHAEEKHFPSDKLADALDWACA